MAEGGAGPSRQSSASTVDDCRTLAELLKLPENANALLVVPVSWCPHISTATCVSTSSSSVLESIKKLDPAVSGCESCGHVGENWACLMCARVFCSRYVNEHMLMHAVEQSHVMSISFSDLSVWCHACEVYVDNSVFSTAKDALHVTKFGVHMPMPAIQLALNDDDDDD